MTKSLNKNFDEVEISYSDDNKFQTLIEKLFKIYVLSCRGEKRKGELENEKLQDI